MKLFRRYLTLVVEADLSKDEYLFACPYCKHHKRKFSVNVEKGYYKCWVCDTRGKNIYRVIRRFGTNTDKSQWRELTTEINFDQLEDLFGEKIEEKYMTRTYAVNCFMGSRKAHFEKFLDINT